MLTVFPEAATAVVAFCREPRVRWMSARSPYWTGSDARRAFYPRSSNRLNGIYSTGRVVLGRRRRLI